MGFRWRLLSPHENRNYPKFIHQGKDVCFYARIYKPYSHNGNTSTKIINNYKKPVIRKLCSDWYYKQRAIRQFAYELSYILNKDYTVASIPTSRLKSDPLYDDRLERTLRILKNEYNPKLRIIEPLKIKKSSIGKHEEGTRNPHIIYENLKWNTACSFLEKILLIDDIITTGSSFTACKWKILERFPKTFVIGVFWGLSMQ